jgi:dolichyl-phosphate-mannose--protein O-mannosyl transferase
LRFLPALCATVTVLLAAWIAARLGGGLFARSLAALCVVTAPLYLGFFSLFSTTV